uniref:Peptidase S1 domain-containing protein n=1 Tax=Anopheles epiroticus TaxID=199890 RepID=A0A182P9F3_9DIPT
MAAIGWTRSPTTINYLCGGSIITLKFVLTAAHCDVDYDNIPPDTVRLGDTHLQSAEDDEWVQQVPIARFIKHPQYRASRKYYDIALVELQNLVNPDDAVCVACVWREPEAPGGKLEAVGFGALGFGGKLSPTLQKVQLETLSTANSYMDWIEKEVNQSLSYKICTGVNMCHRKQSPLASASTVPKWPIARVGLLWEKEETDIYQCGGLLIDFQYVLTSADCVTSNRGSPKFVAASAEGMRVPIVGVFVHPQYVRAGASYDLALLKLSMYANLEETKPICPMIERRLKKTYRFPVGAGASTVARRFHLQYFNSSATNYVLQISSGELCSLANDANAIDLACVKRNFSLVPGTCKVDIGGPVLVAKEEDQFLVYGVISRQTQGCDSDVIFTELAPHFQWLESIVLPPDTVRLGDTNLESEEDDEWAQQIPIARFIKHPRYRESRKYYDIALVELEKRVYSNEAICVACVWREPEAPGGLMDAVGFGALGYGEKLSPTLQKVKLQALEPTVCVERIPTNLCTGVNVCDRIRHPSVIVTSERKWTSSRVGLLWKETETDIFQCGGLLIDYQYVITSADCVTSSRGPPRFVVSSVHSDRAPVEDVFVHPKYSKGQPYFDIAIVKLQKYANMEALQPVCPWLDQKPGDWREAPFLVGASIPAMRSYVEEFNISVKSIVQFHVNGATCKTEETFANNADLVCISNNATLIPGSCEVDYGGPVMTKMANGEEEQFKVHGIVSRLTQRCGSNVIFTRLEPHRQWLESIIFKQLHERLVFNVPPPEYIGRTSLKDCAKRFYSDVGEYTGFYGAFGGVRAYRGEFQHMVRTLTLQVAIGWTRASGKINYLCGGSLISNKFVLTAAHCAWDGDNLRPDTVRAGDTDLGSPEDDEYAQQIAIARLIVHPSYRGSRKYFDIALIELAEQVQFSEAVCPACLWLEKELPAGPMDAVGFGATGFGEALSPTLQRVVLNHLEREECNNRITVNRREMPQGFRADQFCATGSGMDTCEGDSGGPIGVKRLNVGGAVMPLVTGVVSFGTPCTAGSTGVYSKVSEFAEWIEQTTNLTQTYRACTEMFCIGRRKENINVKYESFYTKSRFGLLWNDMDSSANECGATLIDYQYLLTAASCVTTSKGYPKFIISKSGERAAITDVYVSPGYSAGRPENDIALLKIGQYANHTVYRPVCLWDQRVEGKFGYDPRFSGYGQEESYRLLDENLIVVARNGTGCEEELTRGTDLQCFHNDVALLPGVCRMDHGGPIFDNAIWGDPVNLYGIVSPLSKSCGANLFMTDVTPHIPWIEAIVVSKRNQYLVFSD